MVGDKRKMMAFAEPYQTLCFASLGHNHRLPSVYVYVNSFEWELVLAIKLTSRSESLFY